MTPTPNHHIIVTRPSPYGERLTQSLNKAGFNSSHQPLIGFVEDYSVSQESRLQQLAKHGCWIFISQQAVHFLLNNLTQKQLASIKSSEKTIIAVGSATQQALLNYRVKSQLPATQDSEGMLQLVEKLLADGSSKQGRSILLIRGNKGRELLESELPKLGPLSQLQVYRRVINSNQNFDQLRIAGDQHILLVITSEQLLKQAHTLLLQANLPIQQYSLLCASSRISNQAKKLGFIDCTTALSAADDDIINCCHDWLNRPAAIHHSPNKENKL